MTMDQVVCVLEREWHRLYSISRAMMRNEQDALDMLQEASYRACQGAGGLRDEAAAPAWLATILVNCCRTALKKRRAWDEDGLEQAAVPDQTGEIDLRDMVDQLPGEMRQLVAMRYYMNMHLTQIASHLGMPVSTVQSRLARALKRMRQELEAEAPCAGLPTDV